MMLRIFAPALVLLAATACGASAQSPGEMPDCKTATTQTDLTICAGQDFGDADEALNAQYRKTMSALREQDAGLDADQRGAEAALKKAQRAWIEYRDATCEAVGYQAHGGSMEPMLVAQCQAEVTRARTKELATMQKDFSQ